MSGYDFIENSLRDLRIDALKKLTLIAMASAYVFFIWTMWPTNALPERRALSLLCLLLFALGWIAFFSREHAPRLSGIGLVTGQWIICAVITLMFRNDSLGYLFLVPLIFSGTLVGRRSIVVVGLLSGILLSGMLLHDERFIAPLLLLAIATIAISISLQNLYTTLSWALDGYERATRHQNEARERKAELERILKSLEITSHNLHRTNQALEIARDRAEEAQRLKQRFAQSISHELRTPLNLIVGFTENMISSPEYYGTPLPALYMRDMMIVHRNAAHLQKLVNDVLDLSRLEASQMGLYLSETHPGDLAHEAAETIRSLVETKGVSLRISIAPALPPLWVDALRVKQILLNLLSNASRFTQQGSVTVRVYPEADQVVFAVEDTGIGIPEAELAHLFEAFHQIDHPLQQRGKGAGLGLAISRDLARMHGGTITVSSQVGVGSIFQLKLPVNPAETYQPDVQTPHSVTTSPSPKRDHLLILVSQSLSAASLVSRFLSTCRVVVVRDLHHARQVAHHNMPLALVVDVNSQPIEHKALAQEVDTWKLPQMCVITCPLPGESLLQKSLSVNGFLIKPVSHSTLWDTLRSFGEQVNSILVIDDDADFGRLMQRMIDSPLQRYQVSVCTSGQAALDLIQSHAPDLILLDLDMPHMSGLSFLNHLRANTIGCSIPVVIVSGKDTLDNAQLLQAELYVMRPSGLTVVETLKWLQGSLDAVSGGLGLSAR